jgi:hypothetical protein
MRAWACVTVQGSTALNPRRSGSAIPDGRRPEQG